MSEFVAILSIRSNHRRHLSPRSLEACVPLVDIDTARVREGRIPTRRPHGHRRSTNRHAFSEPCILLTDILTDRTEGQETVDLTMKHNY